MGNDFNIATEKLAAALSGDFHAGRAKFTQTSKDGNVANYSLTWTPGLLSSGQTAVQGLTLRYTSSAAAVCGLGSIALRTM